MDKICQTVLSHWGCKLLFCGVSTLNCLSLMSLHCIWFKCKLCFEKPEKNVTENAKIFGIHLCFRVKVCFLWDCSSWMKVCNSPFCTALMALSFFLLLRESRGLGTERERGHKGHIVIRGEESFCFFFFFVVRVKKRFWNNISIQHVKLRLSTETLHW